MACTAGERRASGLAHSAIRQHRILSSFGDFFRYTWIKDRLRCRSSLPYNAAMPPPPARLKFVREALLPRRFALAAAGLVLFHLAFHAAGDPYGLWLPGLGLG